MPRPRKAAYAASVFINCPFDMDYRPLLYAAVFTIFDCGYQPRCAQEAEDGGDVRIDKIKRIIEACKFGIHDISRTELSDDLPRFNMPFELGVYLGAKYFGAGDQGKKVTLILDRERYRYQRYLSDIAGQDIQAHNDRPTEIIAKIRNWLSNATRRSTIPGAARVQAHYAEFQAALPALCAALDRHPDQLLFNEYAEIASAWLDQRDHQPV
jgi:hypothetical protein